MKELSIKEKAKRYDEALWKAGELYQPSYSALLEEIFPELIKYNDEKVRGAIIHFISHTPTVPIGRIDKKTMLAWLEKQGQVNETIISQHENKICKENNDSLTSEDERIRKALINGFNKLDKSAVWYNGITNGQILAWLEKQKTSEEAMQYLKENHSPSEVSDFQTAMNIAVAKAYDKGVKDGLENKGQTFTKKEVDDAYLAGVRDAKQELEKQCGQNPTWSEEDEKMVNNILTPLAGRFPWNIYQPMYDWLKALKGRVGCETDCTTMWKPSEKQIMCLQDALSDYHRRGYKAETLETLLKQLKQL